MLARVYWFLLIKRRHFLKKFNYRKVYHVWSVRSEFFPMILFTQETIEWCKLKQIVLVPLFIYFVILKQFSSSEVCRQCPLNVKMKHPKLFLTLELLVLVLACFLFLGGGGFLWFFCFLFLGVLFGYVLFLVVVFFYQIRVSTIAYSRREYKIRCQEKFRCLLNYNPLLCRITICNECTIVQTCAFPCP